MGIVITDIVKEWGAYYLNSGQNMKSLINQVTQSPVFPSMATPIKTDDTVYRIGNTLFDSLVQPFQKAYTPKGGVEFTPNEIRVFPIKIDLDVNPDDLVASWLGFLASQSLAKKDYPLVKWMMEQYLINKIHEDMELNEYYTGVYKAPTAGTAGPNGTALDGLQKKIKDGLSAGTINSLYSQIGALEDDTIFDQVEASADIIDEKYSGKEMLMVMSPAKRKAYLRDKRSQGFYQKTSDNQIDNSVDFSPIKVVSLPGMKGTKEFFITPKENLLHVTRASANKTTFKVEESKRTVSILTDWGEGLGFGLNEVVWANLNTSSGSGSK
jgi:hypothetical protein